MSRCPVDTTPPAKPDQPRTCGGDLHPGWGICAVHANTLRQDLAELPALAVELDISLTRMAGGLTPGSRATTRGLPYGLGASIATGDIRAVLVGWIRCLDEDPAHHPADTIPAMAGWLLARHDRLVTHPAAGDIVAEITACTRRARSVIFGAPPRVFLGPCPCGGDLHAAKGEPFARCPLCTATHDVAALMATIEAEVDTMLLPVRAIVRLAAFLGQHPDTARTEARINTWVHRGAILRAGHTPDGHPTYRYRQVLDKLNTPVQRSRAG